MRAPEGWRQLHSSTDDANDAVFTVDDVEYVNAVRFATARGVVSVPLPPLALDHLVLRQVPPNHAAFPGRGCFAGAGRLRAGTIVGIYAGVLRPASFSRDNAYVFATQPMPGATGEQWVTDAFTCGNITRFINDPRGSNLEPNLVAVDGFVCDGCLYEHIAGVPRDSAVVVPVVFFKTIVDIESGEELLYNYEAGFAGYWGPQNGVVDLSSSQQQINRAAMLEELVQIRRQFELSALHFSRRMAMISWSGESMEILEAWRNEIGFRQHGFADSVRLFHESRRLMDRLQAGGLDNNNWDHLHMSLLDLDTVAADEEEEEQEEQERPEPMEIDRDDSDSDDSPVMPAVVPQVWRWQATPNGQVSADGRSVSKLRGIANGWNCEVRGSIAWNDAGVHEWRLLLPEGGSGVAVGVCHDNLPSLVLHSANRAHCISLHCATGTATASDGRVKVFQNCSAPGTTIMMRLDLNQRTLLFGINGVWNAAPSFINIGAGAWTPYAGFYYPNRTATIQ
jgi:hypothetical protein